MDAIAVFCGSSPGENPVFIQAAQELGKLLGSRNITLVYGGSNIGLMGKLATAALDAGGNVIGVIPRFLADRGVAFDHLPDQRIVATMHERKALIEQLADAFVALPGGLGTLEEIFEMITWAQLGLHQKPCGLLNIDNYFDSILEFIKHALNERFINPLNSELIITSDNPADLLRQFENHTPRAVDKAKWALQNNKRFNL